MPDAAGKANAKWYSHQLSTQELKDFIDTARNGKDNKRRLSAK
jgi:hypothetical protein